MKLHEIIRENYPEYYSIETYPADKVIPIRKISERYGILGNFAQTDLVVNGTIYKTSEHMFQCLKFTDKKIINAILSLNGMPLKWAAKKYEKEGYVRKDWGKIFIDVMKFCLETKYNQSESFREELRLTADKYIVEDETSRKKGKPADSWGAVLSDDKKYYTGPNLLGRLLMELRKNQGKLIYSLPDNIGK